MKNRVSQYSLILKNKADKQLTKKATQRNCKHLTGAFSSNSHLKSLMKIRNHFN